MLKYLQAIIFLAVIFVSDHAVAQSCSGSPWTSLVNGNSADASQVMNNFYCVLTSPSFSGNVSIGTASPVTTFAVTGQSFMGRLTSGVPNDVLTLNVTGPNYAQFYDVGQTGSAGGLAIGGSNTITEVPTSAVMFWNTNTRNVGVGTTNPVVPFHVVGQAFVSNSTGGAPVDVLTLNVTGPNYAQFYDAAQSGSAGGLAIGGAISVTGIPSSATMFWSTNTGQVGIGTTLPSRTLDVQSSTADTTAGNDAIRIATSGTSGYGAQMLLNSTSITNGRTWVLLSTGSSDSAGVGKFAIVDNNTGDDRLAIDTSGKVGIGTTSPSRSFDVLSSAADTAAGNDAIRIATSGTSGYGAQMLLNSTSITSGHSWVILSSGSSDGASVGKFVIADNSTGNNRFAIDASGNVGIGTTSPAQALEVNGQVRVDTLASASSTSLCITASTNGVIASCSSSIRYKENVREASFGLKEVMAMRPVTFKWKGRDEQDFGLIAEEIAKIDPRYVTYKAGKIEGVKYPQLVAVLANGIKELKTINDGQARDIVKLKAIDDAQDRNITKLQAQNDNQARAISALRFRETTQINQLKAQLSVIERRLAVRTAQR